MTNKPTTQPANSPTDQPDNVTQVPAINGDYLITANLPAMPLTPEERKMEFRTLLDELLATAVGKELFALAIEARRTYIKEIGDIDEAQFWNYFFAGVLQNRERTNALGTALGLDNYTTRPELSNLIATVPEPSLKEFGRALERVGGASEEWQYLDPFPENVSDMIFATLIGEREFDSNNPNEIDLPPLTRIGGENGITSVRYTGDGISVNDIPADRKVFYENGDNPQNYQFCGRKSQLSGVALNVYGSFLVWPLGRSALIHFDYALLRTLDNDETLDLLKFGDKAAIIGFNRTHGLFLNVGNMLSETSTNILVGDYLLPTDSPFPFYCLGRSGADSLDRLYFYVPPELENSSPTIFVLVSFTDEENRDTWAFKQYRIYPSNYTEILESGAIFSDGTDSGLSFNVRYLGDHNGHYAIHLEPTRGRFSMEPTHNVRPGITYKIRVLYSVFQSVNEPMGHAALPLQVATNPVAGIFDPRLDCEEPQRRTGNTVMVELKEGISGYMQARVMVNGIAANNGAFIDTQRTKSDMGLENLSRDEANSGMTIGNDAVRISRVYTIGNEKPLTVAQMRQIYGSIETPGTIYYARRTPEYKLDAKLQVRDSAGEFFTVGANTGGVNLVLDENGDPKNFLTSPILSASSNGQLNQRTIPEMETAKLVVVTGGETDGNILSDSSSETIYDRRSNSAAYCLVCGHSTTYGQRFYFSFPQRNVIRLDHISTPGGQNTGLHGVYLYR